MNIFITGAGQGIGKAVATLAHQQGHTVGIYGLHLEKTQQVADRLNQSPHKKSRFWQKSTTKPRAIAGQMDVTKPADWDRALAEFIAFAGSLDVLVNNAGVLFSGKFNEISLDDHLTELKVNTEGVMLGCYKAKPFLKPHSNAKVINMSSSAAFYGQPDLVGYAASKFFVRGLTEGLDVEWADEGIRCMDMMPLFVDTKMVKGMQAGSIDKLGVRLESKDVAQAMLKVINTPNQHWQNTHHPVGLQAKVLSRLVRITPARVNFMVHQFFNK